MVMTALLILCDMKIVLFYLARLLMRLRMLGLEDRPGLGLVFAVIG